MVKGLADDDTDSPRLRIRDSDREQESLSESGTDGTEMTISFSFVSDLVVKPEAY